MSPPHPVVPGLFCIPPKMNGELFARKPIAVNFYLVRKSHIAGHTAMPGLYVQHRLRRMNLMERNHGERGLLGHRSCPLGLLAVSLRNRCGDEPLASLAARRGAIGSAPIREGCWVNINSHYYVSVRLEFLLHFHRDL